MTRRAGGVRNQLSATPRGPFRLEKVLAVASMHVHIAGFLPLFSSPPSSSSSSSYKLNDIYSTSRICPGVPGFVEKRDAAPAGYCLSQIHQKDQALTIGSEWWPPWESRLVQDYAVKESDPHYDASYDEALERHLRQLGVPNIRFDQFALERLCLARWRMHAPLVHRKRANVVVVPSLLDHFIHLEWGRHLAWNLVLPPSCVPSDPPRALPPHCSTGYGSISHHRKFWSLVRKHYFEPFDQSLVAAPLIIMHHSFTFDNAAFQHVLTSLLEQPKHFVNRVVIITIESNQKRAASSTAGEERTPLQSALPTFLTLPYPTAVAEAVHWTNSTDHHRRPIAILLDADLNRRGGGGKITTNWIRPLLHGALSQKGAVCHGSMCALCSEGTTDCFNEWPLVKQPKTTMWEALVSSNFCLEPAGDTMTRSHMYWAIMSGCIPVPFDGGVSDYAEDEQTTWAFRKGVVDKKPSRLKIPPAAAAANATAAAAAWTLDYREFAIIYPSSKVRSGEVDVASDLLTMPTRDPAMASRVEQIRNKYRPPNAKTR